MPTKETEFRGDFAIVAQGPTDMWRLVADAAIDAIIAIREDGTIILWNQSAASMFGWRSDEVNGKIFVELVLPMTHRKAISNFIETFLRTGDRAIFEKKIEIFGLAKDGREFPIELSIVPQETTAGHTFVAFVRDMTEFKTLNDRLRQSQKMEAIGILAGGIAHEFNNILSSITGNLVLARDDVHADTAVLDSLSEIEKATLRAGHVVRQILRFSTVKETTSEAIDLECTLTEAINLLRATIPSTMVIDMNCEPDLPSILCDSTDIHQVLLNLGINAHQAMLENNGKFDVQVSKVTVDETAGELLGIDPGPYVRMSAGDTGCGMPPETLAKVFEPFFTTKPVGEGTGLGLSVVYGIILRHKGAIAVNSEVGKGTVFHVYFPVVDSPAAVVKEATVVTQQGRGERILYVDDDEALVYMLTRILRRLNYEVVGFTNPKEALEAFRADPEHFDLVITDMSMPYMDGATLVHELQAINPLLPIVLVTGYVQPKDLETARNLGVSQLILKPNTVAEMAEALHRIFRELPKVKDSPGPQPGKPG